MCADLALDRYQHQTTTTVTEEKVGPDQQNAYVSNAILHVTYIQISFCYIIVMG